MPPLLPVLLRFGMNIRICWAVKNEDVREQVELATRYIYRLLSQETGQLEFRKDKKLRVAYHTPCHMEKLGWAYYSIELLKSIPNVELVLLDSQCCGIAGTYGFKKENYKTSQDIGNSLFKQIEESGVDYVVTDCETCKWQIEMSTSKCCKHPTRSWRKCYRIERNSFLGVDRRRLFPVG